MFVMDLAYGMGKTLKQLGEDMGEDELPYWIAKNRIEALPNPWYQTGVICSTMGKAFAGWKNKPEDFIPRARKPVKASAALKAWAALNKKPK